MPQPHSCCPRGAPLAPALGRSFAQITARFLRVTKIHGLRHIGSHQRSRPRCLFWGLAFLLSLGLLGTWSSNRVRYLLSCPVHSRVRMEWATRLHFPAVTLCNNNPVRFPQLTKPDLYSAGQWLGLAGENRSLLPGLLDGLPNAQRHWLSRLANYSRFLPPRRSERTMHSLFHRLGHQIQDMLLVCRFRGEPCGPQHFTPVYTRYGKCYTFNADRRRPRVTRQGGMGNGLELMLDVQQEEYLPIWRETNETSFEAGIRVQIHSQDEPPYIHQLGFGVSPGFQTFVSCQEQRLTYLPQPWGNCRASVAGEQILPGYEGYSIAACRLQCEKEAVVSSCQCRMVHMPGNESICSPNVYIECADRTLDAAVQDSQERCSCPTPCNLTRYSKEISMVRIPNKGSARYLARKFHRNETYIRENFLVLDIFFEALNYEAIEQKKAYELAGLLGDIGGQMGLFIGASILTILEILDYIYEVVRDKVSRALGRAKPPLRKPSGSIATLGLDELKDQSPCGMLGRRAEGTYSTSILPNHRHRYAHQGVFEDFAC
ncbi:acid-sensing ion channel 4 [Gopherus flavomarginatus]|uniref:acid-sensing ion channel 4 n=1 Tax=Gopherus flavomarginatus TaxID=286002 RepID=UPI0021CC1755|nr:acid-sensing ion channel 4 [Gopherus flavomarginatus]XP_050825630.1 acid-sensing ion channel 4 [Gopherus flavomarginatus]